MIHHLKMKYQSVGIILVKDNWNVKMSLIQKELVSIILSCLKKLIYLIHSL